MGSEYILVGWPESQKYMDYEGFDENAEATDESGEYLINKDWIASVENGSVAELD